MDIKETLPQKQGPKDHPLVSCTAGEKSPNGSNQGQSENTPKRRTLSVSQAAAMLGIGRNQAYRLARQGQLPGMIRLGDSRVVVSRATIERICEHGDNGIDIDEE